MRHRYFAFTALFVALSASSAQATLVISRHSTRNVQCSAGVCTATAANARLNHNELQAMLGAGDVTLKSGPLAQDIESAGVIAWSNAHRLTLDAYRSILIDDTLDVDGSHSALTLTTNDGGTGGTLDIRGRGAIRFFDVTSDLVIDGEQYTLVRNVADLASAISTQPSGNFAVPKDFDAHADGVYAQAPIQTNFTGKLEGLGNKIERLSVDASSQSGVPAGLFANESGTISRLHIGKSEIRVGPNASAGVLAGSCGGPIVAVDGGGKVNGGAGSQLGGLCGIANAAITGASSSGTVKGGGNGGTQGAVGGLIGYLQSGTISGSFSTAGVTGSNHWSVGGLVGTSRSAIESSYATGTVRAGNKAVAGGLVGTNTGTGIVDSYARGFVGGGLHSTVGGLLGYNDGPVATSYSTGAVASGSGNAVGGFVGNDAGSPDLTDTYWDIATSGQSHGAGNRTDDPGVTGLTTTQFQAGLPDGFDPAIWAQGAGVNNGYPYLRSLAPN